jgi:hypothetical protein
MLLLLDPGSGMDKSHDPGSGITSRIRNIGYKYDDSRYRSANSEYPDPNFAQEKEIET